MAKVDRSLVADLPLFAGFSAADLDGEVLAENQPHRPRKHPQRCPITSR